ncbi:sensor histidine kinase [Gulosibacter molinativorax]|uniref:histidine kinase n=1 Tax=Gulosibacter molinativorax TaxID=256821 RepID=A0ABT7C725_9MICO|nr:histidine kinase [Gulosibacter molinativorax]MDJ1370602.1 sensor histidine kinase [Gulosibacter molinativorax]QUY61984.1 Oxygen sensor histidine kinase NreB [Gulosibacter molinativorax]
MNTVISDTSYRDAAARPAENEPLPKAPRAWGRDLRFAVQALLDLAGLIWSTIVLVLCFVVVGLWLVPSALQFARENAERSRRLARKFANVDVRAEYRPVEGEPGFAGVRHSWQRLRDPAVLRDLLWQLTNPVVGLFLGLLAFGLALDGVWQLAALQFELAFPAFRPGSYLLLFELWTDSLPLLAVATTIASILQILLGWWLARPTLRALGAWTRAVLHVENTEALRRRVARLETTRADALDLEQAELRRIERDLHDGAQMRLVATGLTIGEATRLVRDDPDAAIELLQQAKDESAAALGELRHLVRGIMPPVLADRGLVDALRSLAADAIVPTTVTSNLEVRLAAPLESALYFAVTELVTNATKHARASSIRVDVQDRAGAGADAVRVLVIDDGIGGMDAEASPDRAGGLAGVRRRLDTFDATLTVVSPSGGPTVITIDSPRILATPLAERPPSLTESFPSPAE